MNDKKPTSREEDFRDYEDRNLRDGWPYADRDRGRSGARNEAYGRQAANFEDDGNIGVEIAGGPELVDVDGGPLPFSDDVDSAIADDDLEERVTELLERAAEIDTNSLEIAVKKAMAIIEGSVDSEADRARLVALVARIPGVRGVDAERLLTRGVDSHIPADADD